MRKRRSIRKKILTVALAIPLGYLLLAGLAAFIPLPGTDGDTPGAYPAYLASNGIHTNIVLPVRSDVADWSALLPDAGLGDKAYVYIGWGSAEFYTQVDTWADLRPAIALRALFYDKGLLRIEGAYHPPPAGHKLVRPFQLERAQYQRLSADILAQFQARTPLAGHPGFYPAKGHYTPLFTCNEWVRVRLRRIGVRTPLWSPFDRPLLWAL